LCRNEAKPVRVDEKRLTFRHVADSRRGRDRAADGRLADLPDGATMAEL
jgi:hypothetical protein